MQRPVPSPLGSETRWPGSRLRSLGRRAIASGFTTAERERFQILLKVAAESPFEGERVNALAAATRLAAKHGLSLEEAAAGHDREAQRPEPEPRWQAAQPRPWWHDPRISSFVHLMDEQIRLDKLRREHALQDAYARGLDADLRRRQARSERAEIRVTRSGRKREPTSHARVLLRETSLPLGEISAITGLDLHEVVALRLKMRDAV